MGTCGRENLRPPARAPKVGGRKTTGFRYSELLWAGLDEIHRWLVVLREKQDELLGTVEGRQRREQAKCRALLPPQA